MIQDGQDPNARLAPRREMLDYAVSGLAALLGLGALYPVARLLAPLPGPTVRSVSLGPVSAFAAGSARSALFGSRPIVAIRAADGSFRAFGAECTHLGCIVHYVPARDRLECACHGGRFGADGRVLAGPPRRPLESLRIDVVDGEVMVGRA
jgi:cytochrome b6-f complex iron-sulfur subunit